jgi:hypothetical protein
MDRILFLRLEINGAGMTLIAFVIFVALVCFAYSVRETMYFRAQEADAALFPLRK